MTAELPPRPVVPEPEIGKPEGDLVPCAYCGKLTPPERQAAKPWNWPRRGLVTNCFDCATPDCIDQ